MNVKSVIQPYTRALIAMLFYSQTALIMPVATMPICQFRRHVLRSFLVNIMLIPV